MQQYQKITLPIDKYLNEILNKVEHFSTILIKASPGSGKTTRLPWFIAKNIPGKILVLEPRRIAAKLAAQRIAQEENFNIGSEVGYHFRFEKKVSPATRLIFYTEGTFLKSLISDPELQDVSVVILDEFHERHLETDMALAYLRGVQKKRPELKIIIMSATLDQSSLTTTNSVSIEIEAPHYPVTINYLPNVPSELGKSLEVKIKNALDKSPEGDVLIFLPGMREILKVKNYLGDKFGAVYILHSEVPKEEQEAALSSQDVRKIILSTNIAESSVTISGITTVIDSGIHRGAHYSPWNGLKFVQDTKSTKSSAIQRAGRAGRTGPGVCHRLYSEQDFNSREDHIVPEILKADLTDAYILSQEFSVELEWPTPPPKDRWKKAQDLCFLLGIVDQHGVVTDIGRKVQNYPVDVRLGRVLLAGEEMNRSSKEELLRYICSSIEKDNSGVLYRKLSKYTITFGSNPGPWEKCVLTGFIDQVAKFRKNQHDFIHFSGKTIKGHPSKQLHGDYFIILEISQRQEAVEVFSIEEEWLYDMVPFPFIEELQIEITEKFNLKKQTKLGSIVVDELSSKINWNSLNADDKLKVVELSTHPFKKKWTDWQNSELFGKLQFWSKIKSFNMDEAIQKIKLEAYFEFSPELSWLQLENYFEDILKQNLEAGDLSRFLPDKVNFGARRDMKVHYPINLDPYVEAPIQEFYGVKETPKIAGSYPLTLKLLGPHKRPIQVTKDLTGFWRKTYHEIKKELMREYPRHYWPEDPANSPPLLLKSHLPKS